MGRNFYNIFEYFSPKNFPLLFELKALVKHYDSVARYFDDPHLRAAFTFQDMYLGLSPYEALATYSLLQYTEMVNGVYFPMGGLYKVVETLVEIAEGLGVTFRYEAPVARILVDRDKATGVELADGERVDADLIVANADLPYVYEHLLPRDERAIRRLNNLKYTCSTLMFFWGVDKVYPQIDHHNVFLAGEYKASFDSIFNAHRLPDDPSFYVHAPARADPSAAPEGEDTLMALVPVGHLSEEIDQEGEDSDRQLAVGYNSGVWSRAVGSKRHRWGGAEVYFLLLWFADSRRLMADSSVTMPTPDPDDYIIAGGGLAGLSLACHMVRTRLRERSILIVDGDPKKRNDRTFGFWANAPTIFDDAIWRSWDKLQVASEANEPRTIPLGDYRYHVIRGVDFYEEARRQLAAFDTVRFLQGRGESIEDGRDAARVVVDGHPIYGRWVFDSLPHRSKAMTP